MSVIALIDRERLIFAKRVHHMVQKLGSTSVGNFEASCCEGVVEVSACIEGNPVSVKFSIPAGAWSARLHSYLVRSFLTSATIALRQRRSIA